MFALFTDRRGVAALELALVAPAVLLLLMGVVDLGQLAYTVSQVRAAADAGAVYVSQNGCAATSVAGAITGATSLAVTANPAPKCGVYYCPVSGGQLAAEPSGAACADGETAGTYATLTAQASFKPVAPWTGFVLPTTVTANSAIRYQ